MNNYYKEMQAIYKKYHDQAQVERADEQRFQSLMTDMLDELEQLQIKHQTSTQTANKEGDK